MENTVKLLLSLMLTVSATNAWSAPGKAMGELKKLDKGEKMGLPNPGKPSEADAYTTQNQEDTKLVSHHGNTWVIGNVRWQDYYKVRPGEVDAVTINASMLKRAYWGTTDMNDVGHSIMVFEFHPGGLRNPKGAYQSDHLVISSEGRIKKSAMGIGKIWVVSSLEVYHKTKVKHGMALYAFQPVVNGARLLNAAMKAATGNYDNVRFNILTNNCNTNTLNVVNSVLPEGQQFMDIRPFSTLKKLQEKGIVAKRHATQW